MTKTMRAVLGAGYLSSASPGFEFAAGGRCKLKRACANAHAHVLHLRKAHSAQERMWFLATTAFAPMPGAKLTCPSEGLRHLTLHGGSRILMDDLAPVTAYVTPNALAPPEVRTTWSNYMTSDGGMNITTTTGIREAHTRMALHMHEFGGQTCVLAGAPATVFVGGATSRRKSSLPSRRSLPRSTTNGVE